MNRTRTIRTAAILAIAGNSLLAAVKLVFGVYANSAALLGDGIDSSADVLMSLITLAVLRVMAKPADVRHPFGHRKAETIATAFVSFVIFFAGAQLALQSALSLLRGAHTAAPSAAAVVVAAISVAGKLLLALSQRILGRRTASTLLLANAKNMAADVAISVGVLLGFLLSAVAGSGRADSVVALLVGLWIIRTAFGIFMDITLELMDGSDDATPYRAIVEAVETVGGASNPHRARARRIAGLWDIEFDIDIDPNCTVAEAHHIATQVEQEIKRRVENVFDIMIHIEPRGDHPPEAFGLSEEDMRG